MRVINTLLVRRISSKCIQKPVPFHLVPYDEQYETRDFKRNVTSYPRRFKEELEELDTLNNAVQKHIKIDEQLEISTKENISEESK